MAYIYRPKGKAGEYGELALNHYKGCSHGCKVCWAPAVLHQTSEQFHSNPQPRALDQRILEKELQACKGKSVVLCFTCDAYQPIESDLKITRSILEKFRTHGVHPNILTKGGMRSTRDFDLLSHDPKSLYGATLTFLNPEDSLKWEPGAALPQERIEALQRAHEMGIATWVSFEPILDPSQSLALMKTVAHFVDEYKIGRLNYHPHAARIDWRAFAERAVDLCQNLGKKFYIKRDLAVFLKK